MSGTVAGNPANYPTTITTPDDGDSAAVVAAGLEGIADRTAHLHDNVGSAVQWSLIQASMRQTADPRFIFQELPNVGLGWLQFDVTDAGLLVFPLNPPRSKIRFQYITAMFACDAHAVDLVAGGATLPRITLMSEDRTQKISPTTVSYQDDLSGTQAAFEALHPVIIDLGAPIEWDADGDYLLYVRVEGETDGTGTGAEASKLLLKDLTVTLEP